MNGNRAGRASPMYGNERRDNSFGGNSFTERERSPVRINRDSRGALQLEAAAEAAAMAEIRALSAESPVELVLGLRDQKEVAQVEEVAVVEGWRVIGRRGNGR